MSTLRELVDEYERTIILRTLVQNDYDREKTSEALGVPKTTLWNLIKRHKIEEPEGTGGAAYVPAPWEREDE